MACDIRNNAATAVHDRFCTQEPQHQLAAAATTSGQLHAFTRSHSHNAASYTSCGSALMSPLFSYGTLVLIIEVTHGVGQAGQN